MYTETDYLKQHCWLLPVLRLTEVTMTENSLRLAGKILVLVKLMALKIYAKAGLLSPRPRTCSHKTKATNFGLNAKTKAN